MAVSLSLDPYEGVWTLRQRGSSLLDRKTLAEWREQLLDALWDLDRPIDLLVDLEGLRLHPSVAPAYAFVICRTPAIRKALYYNADRATAAALKLAYAYVRLHPDRASALAMLDDMRGGLVLRRSGTVLAPSAVNELLHEASGNANKRR